MGERSPLPLPSPFLLSAGCPPGGLAASTWKIRGGKGEEEVSHLPQDAAVGS